MAGAPERALHGRVALVTGASRGIGRGLAVGLGELGARVLITGRKLESLEETAELVRLAGGKCEPFAVDHGSDAAVAALFDTLRARFDADGTRLDILVNNAYSAISFLLESLAVPAWEKSAANPSEPDARADPGAVWDHVNGVGLRNNFVCTTYALRQFVAQGGGGGVVVNVSSFGGIFQLFDAAYGIGKVGVDRMSAEFARAAPPGVVCFTLYPGLVRTEAFSEQVNQWETGSTSAPNDHGLRPWNFESPLFVGRALALGLADEALVQTMKGKVVVAAELGARVGATDEDGRSPLSVRSLRFSVLQEFPSLIASPLRHLIPDIYLPLWLIMKKAGMLKMW